MERPRLASGLRAAPRIWAFSISLRLVVAAAKAPVAGGDLTTALLRRVSRSFYLSVAVLPRAVRPTIGLAYLLARASDTIADTRLIDRAARIGHLEGLRGAFADDGGSVAAVVGATAPSQALASERALLALDLQLAILHGFHELRLGRIQRHQSSTSYWRYRPRNS